MATKRSSFNKYFNTLNSPDKDSRNALVFDLSEESDNQRLEEFILKNSDNLIYHDALELQIKELKKIRTPQQKFSNAQLEEYWQNWQEEVDLDRFGCMVFYPWSNRLVRLVDRASFIELRTARNKYKITKEEQDQLAQKTVGVIGLSVGQSVAVTMAIERVFGCLRIADFDHLELTNLNRIRTGVQNLGLSKTTAVCREIAEIDPFLKVEIFDQGITEGNIDDFLGSGVNKLDVLVEECDSLDIKILARLRAREKQIPVLMDTSDRGMVDIERFDENPQRPILHGRVDVEDVSSLRSLSYEEKIPFLLEMVGADQMSPRLKSSMLEVEQSLSSWPQLAGDVAMGGAVCTEFVRTLLLGGNLPSGRFYIDPLDFIRSEQSETTVRPKLKRLDLATELAAFEQYNRSELDQKVKDQLIEAAIAAPSAGNVQPWKFTWHHGYLMIFLDPNRIEFFGDYQRFASLLSVGAVLENLELTAHQLELKIKTQLYPNGQDSLLAAAVSFYPHREGEAKALLADFIHKRHTNRNLDDGGELPIDFLQELQDLHRQALEKGVSIQIIQDEQDIHTLGRAVAKADVQRLLHKEGHQGFYHEIRWGDDEARRKGDGIDIETVEVSPSELAGFSIARDWEAVKLLSEKNLGSAFGRLSLKQIRASRALIHIAARSFDPEHIVAGGRVMEQTWLLAEKYGIGYHPLLSTCLFYNQYRHGGRDLMPQRMQNTLALMEQEYKAVLPHLEQHAAEVFMARLFMPQKEVKRAYRRPKKELLVD